jgi:hypothetical protein
VVGGDSWLTMHSRNVPLNHPGAGRTAIGSSEASVAARSANAATSFFTPSAQDIQQIGNAPRSLSKVTVATPFGQDNGLGLSPKLPQAIQQRGDYVGVSEDAPLESLVGGGGGTGFELVEEVF